MIQTAIQFPFALSPETANLASKLSATIENHNAFMAQVDSDSAELSSVPAADWTSHHGTEAAKVRGRRLNGLAAEISIREEIADYYSRLEAKDYPAAQQVARDEFDRAKAEVSAALLALGYHGDDITFDMLGRHPRVKAARIEVDTLTGRRPWHDSQLANVEAMRKARQTIESLKSKDLALSA